MRLTKVTLFLAVIALPLATFLLPQIPVRADDLQNEAACQDCLDAADQAWRDCVAVVQGDDGDVHCRWVRDSAKAECQRTVCID